MAGDLVDRLSVEQPIVASLRPEATAAALKAALDRGVVHVRFTETRGGTELGVHVDTAGTDASAADFDNARGTLRLAGTLTLDFVPVRFEGTIALEHMSGTGVLRRAAASAHDAHTGARHE